MPGKDSKTLRIEAITLSDGELTLRFDGKKQVTEPDNEIQAYCFTMINSSTGNEMGGINIKAGYTENIVNYRGNIGFTVYDSFRGKHYSARGCVLLIPVIVILEMTPVWLTCNIDNIPSKRNIERIGAIYIDTVKVPEEYYPYYPENARVKNRYRWEPVKA
jgi:predicted acetyltransferase